MPVVDSGLSSLVGQNGPQDRIMGLYAIYDLVAGAIVGDTVFLAPHVAPARRTFRDACTRDPDKNRIAAAPQDYALVYLGAVSIFTLSVVDVGSYVDVVDSSHRAVVCTGPQVLA